MADELGNARIDQHPLGIPATGDFGIYRDMVNSITKRFDLTPFLPSAANNIEWVSTTNYALNAIVTYGGKIWQSQIADNLGVVPGSDVNKWVAMTQAVNWARWAAGVFLDTDVFVIRLIDGEDHIAQLVSGTRPYNSTNFDTEYAAGDWKSLTQNHIIKAVDVGANTASLNMNYLKKRSFNFAATISEAKTWSIANGGNLIKLNALFEMASLDPQTFPAGLKLFTYAGLWDDGTKIWTPTDLGKYEIEIMLSGGVHWAKLFGPF